MRKMMVSPLIALAILLLAACSSGLDRKIDGSSEAAFAASLEAIKKSAKPEEVAELDAAFSVLAVSDVSIGYEGGILGALQKLTRERSVDQLAESVRSSVAGKTGREIIAAGKKRRKDEAVKQLANTEREMLGLNKLREENAAKRSALDGIQVLEPTLRFSNIGPDKMSIMDFKVRNATDAGLTYLFMRGTVAEAAGGKVLHSDDINYKLSDEPLLPGATKIVRLPNSTRGKWNAPEIWGRDDLVFKIEVLNAEDLSGKKLTTSFTHKDAARLSLLEKNKVELERMLVNK
jgi:hypothetical protein